MPKRFLPEICTVEDCDRKAVCKGLCMRCYGRMKNPPKTKTRPNRKSLLSDYAEEWKILNAMRARCNNPKNASYKNYGGRGIKVCDRWLGKDGLKNFIADMGKRPGGYTKNGHPEYTIDRIDCDKDYSPENCKWSNIWEQNSNTRRNNKVVGVHQETDTLWSSELTINGVTHRKRFHTEQEAIDYRKWLESTYLTKTQ